MGEPVVTDVAVGKDVAPDELLRLAAVLEKGSRYPFARAIVREGEARLGPLPYPQDFESVSGQGVRGRVDGRRLSLGSLHLMQRQKAVVGHFQRLARQFVKDVKSVIWVACENQVVGLIALGDREGCGHGNRRCHAGTRRMPTRVHQRSGQSVSDLSFSPSTRETSQLFRSQVDIPNFGKIQICKIR